MTEGYVEPLDERHRTHHKKKWLSKHYQMPTTTSKRVRSEGTSKTLLSRDIGGHTQYMPMWIQDMYKRRIQTLVIVIDHRHLTDRNNTDNQLAVATLLTIFSTASALKELGLLQGSRSRKWRPKRILIVANKADFG